MIRISEICISAIRNLPRRTIRCLRKMQGLYYYVYTHILFIHRYQRRYFVGRWFCSKESGKSSAIGWKNAVICFRENRRLNVNTTVPWPVSPQARVVGWENITFSPDDMNNFQSPGIYLQAAGQIIIGKGTYIAPGVGIITANHKRGELDMHDLPKPVVIGEKCWIGMNAVILPGVVLGNNTIVGAGAVVTKPFVDGNCTVAGNPARIINGSIVQKDDGI